MNGTASIGSKRKLIHFAGCVYEKRIKDGNKLVRPRFELRAEGWRDCRFCMKRAGLLGQEALWWEREAFRKGVTLAYDARVETVYLDTGNGFWKVLKNPSGAFVLYHRNEYRKSLSEEELKSGGFHRQGDVRPQRSLSALIDYVKKHDQAKLIIADDYRKLPQQTKKQRKYFRQAERRAVRNKARRVWDLFEQIERERTVMEAVDAVCGCIADCFDKVV